LDTQVLLWSSFDALSSHAEDVIGRRADSVFVSAVSVWEIEIKRASGRLSAPTDVAGMVHDAGFVPLPVTFEHALSAGRLPPLHRDPFDRMLVAQARTEGLTLVTSDRVLARYDVATLSVARR
jgi:PIN domain nuclease of toxin-antitoxin system